MAEDGFGEPADRKELLANIRRLTNAVLDNLEVGSRNKTLDQAEKRLLSSTGARLLRLWRSTLKDESSNQSAGNPRERSVESKPSNGRASLNW